MHGFWFIYIYELKLWSDCFFKFTFPCKWGMGSDPSIDTQLECTVTHNPIWKNQATQCHVLLTYVWFNVTYNYIYKQAPNPLREKLYLAIVRCEGRRARNKIYITHWYFMCLFALARLFRQSHIYYTPARLK